MLYSRLFAMSALAVMLAAGTTIGSARAGEALAAPLPGATDAPAVVESTPAPEQGTEASQSIIPSEEPAGVQQMMPEMGFGPGGDCPHRRAKVEPTV